MNLDFNLARDLDSGIVNRSKATRRWVQRGVHNGLH